MLKKQIHQLQLRKKRLCQFKTCYLAGLFINCNFKINYKYIFDDTKSNFSTSNLWKDIELFLADESNLRDIDVLFDIPYEYLSYLIKDNKLVDLTNKIDKSTLDNTYYPIIDISKKAGGGNIYFLSPTY